MHGARCDVVNENGDTFVLLCARNGQPEILSLFLQYCEPEFIARKAHIDGFNVMFASVEGNRPECIKALSDYGVIVNQFTDDGL
jgi:hypothetical protein